MTLQNQVPSWGYAEVLPVRTVFLYFILSCCPVRFTPRRSEYNWIGDHWSSYSLLYCCDCEGRHLNKRIKLAVRQIDARKKRNSTLTPKLPSVIFFLLLFFFVRVQQLHVGGARCREVNLWLKNDQIKWAHSVFRLTLFNAKQRLDFPLPRLLRWRSPAQRGLRSFP